jgi:ankyrin repeat protein
MDFIKRNYTATKKYVQHWINPNENPTDLDKYAFNLLEKAEVDLFIEFMEMNKVNINVVDYSKISLLIKAQGIPTYTNQHTKLLTEEELERRAVKAINYLVKKGCDINYRGKNGATALLSASHWGYYSIVKALLLHGANPNI